jgi:hypothetical protein
MEDKYEEELIMYEESREIQETIWKIWDIINDKEIISTLLLNSSLLKNIKNYLPNTPLDSKDNKKEQEQPKIQEKEINEEKNKSEDNGNFIFI